MLPAVAVFVALAVAAMLAGVAGPAAVHRLRPGRSVPLLTAATLAVALAGGLALGSIAVAMLAGTTALADAGDDHWSAAVVHAELPVPSWLGTAAGVAVTLLLARAVLRALRIGVAFGRADRLARRLRGRGGPVVLIADPAGDAYTIAGGRGCVVISRELYSALSRPERSVVTAHELSHLHRRHHLYVHLADLAAAANPLLRGVSAAVRLGVERWADEDAARMLGDRAGTARALAGVALHRHRLSRSRPDSDVPLAGPRWALGVATAQVTTRVTALLEPPPRDRGGRMLATAGCAVLALLLGVGSLRHVHEAIEVAQRLTGR